MLALFIILSVCAASYSQHLDKIIQNRIKEAESYKLPKSNEEFEESVKSNKVHTYSGTYDFVIIGAGSAGSVLATRLSEIEESKILLLEAGDDEDDFSKIPSMMFYLQFSEMNWGYYTTPQSTCCLGMKDKKCMIPRGKALGGSSSINTLMYVRGNSKDFDKWEEMGNSGWSYKSVLPYFKKSEHSTIMGDFGYHGENGFWDVEHSKPPTTLHHSFIFGSKEKNISLLDYNGRNQFGASKPQFNTKNGVRQSLNTAFLTKAKPRKNLHIQTKAFVTKIYIDPETKTAKEVEFVTKNKKFKVEASKEIILSAGAINSPQILMLSGVGPKEHLTEIGIETIQELPVGKNLIDHPFFMGLIFHRNTSEPSLNLQQQVAEYEMGLGPLTKPSSRDGIAFIPHPREKNNVPSLEYVLNAVVQKNSSFFGQTLNYNDDLVKNFLGKTKSNDFILGLALLHPKSRGQITLKSSSPIDFPNIDLNMLAEQEDIDKLIKGVKFLLRLIKTEAFKSIGTELINIPICSDFTKISDEFWECALRHLTGTIYHPCGTTAMGSDPDSSVVDSNLNVHGVKNLRVVDAGVFPSSISGHTNAATVMIAEKISELIKKIYY